MKAGPGGLHDGAAVEHRSGASLDLVRLVSNAAESIFNAFDIEICERYRNARDNERANQSGASLTAMDQHSLSEASKVSVPSIKRLEGKPGPLAAQERTIDALRQALEAAGVTFLEDGATSAGGPGVRLTRGEILPTASSKRRVEGNDNDEAGEEDERREAND